MPRDFHFRFFINQFPPSPWEYHQGHFEFFQKFAEIFTAQRAPPVSLTPMANEKNFNQKSFNYFLEHLCIVELTCSYIFSFKFTLRYQQSDIDPIICRYSIVDTGVSSTSGTGGKICHRHRWYRWQIGHWCSWHWQRICCRCH